MIPASPWPCPAGSSRCSLKRVRSTLSSSLASRCCWQRSVWSLAGSQPAERPRWNLYMRYGPSKGTPSLSHDTRGAKQHVGRLENLGSQSGWIGWSESTEKVTHRGSRLRGLVSAEGGPQPAGREKNVPRALDVLEYLETGKDEPLRVSGP